MARALLVFILVLSCVAVSVQGKINITEVLNQFPDYSLFNQWLTSTGVIKEVNNRTSITVLATSNADLQAFLSSIPNAYSKPDLIADTLRYQILLTYFGFPELQKIKVNNFTSVTTLLQTTGRVSGSGGFVDLYNTGKKFLVGEFYPSSHVNETILGNVTQIPFQYSILQISSILLSPPTVGAPAPAPVGTASNSSLTAGPLGSKPKGYANALSISTNLVLVAMFLASIAPML